MSMSVGDSFGGPMWSLQSYGGSIPPPISTTVTEDDHRGQDELDPRYSSMSMSSMGSLDRIRSSRFLTPSTEGEIKKRVGNLNRFNLPQIFEQDWDLTYPPAQNRPMSRSEVEARGKGGDAIEVIRFGQVLNLSDLFEKVGGEKRSRLTTIYKLRGKDISHWFDPITGDPQTRVDINTGNRIIYAPDGTYYGLYAFEKRLKEVVGELDVQVSSATFFQNFMVSSILIEKESEGNYETDDQTKRRVDQVIVSRLKSHQDQGKTLMERRNSSKSSESQSGGERSKSMSPPEDKEEEEVQIIHQPPEVNDADEPTLEEAIARIKSPDDDQLPKRKPRGRGLEAQEEYREFIWWKDARRVVGYIPERTFNVRVVNALNRDEVLLEACKESTPNDLLRAYLSKHNPRAANYIWKDIFGNILHPHKRLEENGLMDNSDICNQTGLDHFPTILLYYKDGFEFASRMKEDALSFEGSLPMQCRIY